MMTIFMVFFGIGSIIYGRLADLIVESVGESLKAHLKGSQCAAPPLSRQMPPRGAER
jgi:MFS family permease